MSENPRLRPLDFQPVTHLGQQMWYLRDPLQLTPYQLIMPPALAQMLMYCDGTRTATEIHSAFCRHVGQQVDFDLITDALEQLDKACLLDNAHARQVQQDMLAAYRAQPHRPPALADLSYPGDPQALTAALQAYGAGDDLNGWQPWHGRGIISPHIDYQRGGPVYAKVWRRAETAVAQADLVVIFGTDHNGSAGSVTLTRQAYATPYGILPTDTALIDKLAAAVGEEAAFAEELHHRQEHSVELSAVWLHYTYQKLGLDPKPMIPILCGSFHHFVTNGSHPADDAGLTAVIDTLQRETRGKNILVVASVDFAHVGPNFGDNFIMDQQRRTSLKTADDSLMTAILNGDAADFYRQIAAVQDRNRICGFSSIYLMLRYLQGVHGGYRVAYDHCPADPEDNSLVSISGLLLN
ncbi:MAG: AmmeMemoRadiSam system protein B [Ardenticatenaceae bacterium]|nr:AmmeMemoRadiSam system protein B [Ardenticatenaceae bacterium]MCB8986453.1 AmmeMemoRadiSam system protein B [Ardenticatenaceae bacterium]